MGIITNFTNLYERAFSNCGPRYMVIFLKVYTAFCGIMLSMALYAVMYRALTNYTF